MQKNSKIYIAGHTGMVGSAILRKLKKEGYTNIITTPSEKLDLRHQLSVRNFFEKENPKYVILAAAKVGGIYANNKYKAEFIYDNLMIQSNVIHSSYLYNVEKLLFLGSSCIYPKITPQPIKEDYLLSGQLEPTNRPYAVAKIAGIELCKSYRAQYGCNFISAMPTNLYGINDNYHPKNSHVIPALLRKVFLSKEKNLPFFEVWGSGSAKREFLYVDDLADACFILLNDYNNDKPVNIGSGSDISIKDLVKIIIDEFNYKGDVKYDLTKPDGTLLKLLDSTLINSLGWKPKISINEGIRKTILDLKTI